MKRKLFGLAVLCVLVVGSFSCSETDKGTGGDTTPAPNPDGKLYVLNQKDSTIYIYDTKTFTRIDSFPAQVGAPHYIRFSPDGANYYIVTLQPNGRLAKYETATNNFLGFARAAVNLLPSAIAFNATGQFGYVCNFTSGINLGKMYKFDLSAMTVVDSLPSGATSHDLKNTSDGRWIIASNLNTEDVTIVDTQNDDVVRVSVDPDSLYAPTGAPKYGPFGVEIGPNDSLAYIACLKAYQVRVLDIAQQRIVDSFLIPRIASDPTDSRKNGPTLMSVSPDNETVYVTMQWSNRIVAINRSSGSVTGSLFFETPRPFGISMSDDGSRVYVACVGFENNPGAVYSIDTKTFTKIDSVDVGLTSMGLIYRAP